VYLELSSHVCLLLSYSDRFPAKWPPDKERQLPQGSVRKEPSRASSVSDRGWAAPAAAKLNTVSYFLELSKIDGKL
jgi:hypothetical protein